jgi:hypothetical protein
MAIAPSAQMAPQMLHARLAESQRSTARSIPTTIPVNAASAEARAIGRYFQGAIV